MLTPLLCALAFVALATGFIVFNHYPMPYDELEHVSYAAFLQETGRLLPKFEIQQTLVIDDISRWDNRANYLGHPSPYYLYISHFLDRSLTTGHAVLALRLASFALILAGVGLALSAGWRHFGSDRLAGPTFCLLLAFCPKLLAISGQVTNDALAFLGGGLAYWGASNETGRPGVFRGNLALVAVATGLTFALWAKPNAGLAVGLWLGWVALLRPGPRLKLIGVLVIGGLIGSVPYWFILYHYGALVPITVEQFGHVRQLPDFAAYLPAFLLNVAYSWSYLQMGTWPAPGPAGLVAAGLAWLLLAFVVLGGVMAIRRRRTTRDVLALAATLAFLMVFPIHFWFSATRLGFSLPAASFRYYLPIWPALTHAIAYAIQRARAPWSIIITGISLTALAIGWLSL